MYDSFTGDISACVIHIDRRFLSKLVVGEAVRLFLVMKVLASGYRSLSKPRLDVIS
jgi:hypothetical protein